MRRLFSLTELVPHTCHACLASVKRQDLLFSTLAENRFFSAEMVLAPKKRILGASWQTIVNQ